MKYSQNDESITIDIKAQYKPFYEESGVSIPDFIQSDCRIDFDRHRIYGTVQGAYRTDELPEELRSTEDMPDGLHLEILTDQKEKVIASYTEQFKIDDLVALFGLKPGELPIGAETQIYKFGSARPVAIGPKKDCSPV